jgi:hypothetical protein
MRTLLLAPLLAACGSAAPPAPSAPSRAETADPSPPLVEPAAEPLRFELDGEPWQITAAGGAVEPPGRVVTADFTLVIERWPRSDDYQQTLAGVKEGMAEPDAPVLHERDGGSGDYELILDLEEGVRGAVLRPGTDAGAMCMFDLADGADWAAPLAACRSLARAP